MPPAGSMATCSKHIGPPVASCQKRLGSTAPRRPQAGEQTMTNSTSWSARRYRHQALDAGRERCRNPNVRLCAVMASNPHRMHRHEQCRHLDTRPATSDGVGEYAPVGTEQSHRQRTLDCGHTASNNTRLEKPNANVHPPRTCGIDHRPPCASFEP